MTEPLGAAPFAQLLKSKREVEPMVGATLSQAIDQLLSSVVTIEALAREALEVQTKLEAAGFTLGKK